MSEELRQSPRAARPKPVGDDLRKSFICRSCAQSLSGHQVFSFICGDPDGPALPRGFKTSPVEGRRDVIDRHDLDRHYWALRRPHPFKLARHWDAADADPHTDLVEQIRAVIDDEADLWDKRSRVRNFRRAAVRRLPALERLPMLGGGDPRWALLQRWPVLRHFSQLGPRDLRYAIVKPCPFCKAADPALLLERTAAGVARIEHHMAEAMWWNRTM